MKGSLRNASQSFICRCCKVNRPITDGLNTDLHLDIGNGVSLNRTEMSMIRWMYGVKLNEREKMKNSENS